MTHSDVQYMNMVFRQTMENLRKMFAKSGYNMMGEGFGTHDGFICQILCSDGSYFLTVRFNEKRNVMWMQLFLPVWIPHDKREQVAAFLSAATAKRTRGRLSMDERGLVYAHIHVELGGYRNALKALQKQLGEKLDELGSDAQALEKLLVEHCAPDVKTLEGVRDCLLELVFDCENDIVSMVCPGARFAAEDDTDDADDAGDAEDADDADDAADVPFPRRPDGKADVSSLNEAFRRLLEEDDGEDAEDAEDDGDGVPNADTRERAEQMAATLADDLNSQNPSEASRVFLDALHSLGVLDSDGDADRPDLGVVTCGLGGAGDPDVIRRRRNALIHAVDGSGDPDATSAPGGPEDGDTGEEDKAPAHPRITGLPPED